MYHHNYVANTLLLDKGQNLIYHLPLEDTPTIKQETKKNLLNFLWQDHNVFKVYTESQLGVGVVAVAPLSARGTDTSRQGISDNLLKQHRWRRKESTHYMM